MTVVTGVTRLCADPDLLGGGRWGLLSNFTGTMPDLSRNAEALLASGVEVTVLLGPEHGPRGTVQAGASEPAKHDETTGLPILDTYDRSGDELDALLDSAGIDGVLFDMQDIGVRFYTYVWSMYDLMGSAARTGKRFVVLDRPNPLGGLTSSGPGLAPGFVSFVGRVDIPVRHGLTAGELARHVNPALPDGPVDLEVVAMEGWERHQLFDATGLDWVPPSPNMATLETAFVFGGTGLFEGTNVSEGRGTTHPFELIGAPWFGVDLVPALRELGLPGVAFREAWFIPTFHKHAGAQLRGVQLHVRDRHQFDPVRTGVALMSTVAALHPEEFRFLPSDGSSVSDPPGFPIDSLWGSSDLRKAVEAGDDPLGLLPDDQPEPTRWAADAVLYA